MSKKKTPVRLSTKALTALKNTYATGFKERASKLEKIQEYSFSIILKLGLVTERTDLNGQ